MLRLALRPIQPPIQWVLGTVSLGVKQRGCDAVQSLPPTAKVMSYTPFPHAFTARHNFTATNQSRATEVQ
jgi:hypothetical protein